MVVVTVLILNRVLPVVKGSARPGDSRDEKFLKWNSFIMPMMRRHLKDGMQAALAGSFVSELDGNPKTVGTWSLESTVLPDVDFIAIARPDESDEGKVKVLGFMEAELLQDYLEGTVQMQTMFGHITWIYTRSENLDFEHLLSQLIEPHVFRETHGLPNPEDHEDEEEEEEEE